MCKLMTVFSVIHAAVNIFACIIYVMSFQRASGTMPAVVLWITDSARLSS